MCIVPKECRTRVRAQTILLLPSDRIHTSTLIFYTYCNTARPERSLKLGVGAAIALDHRVEGTVEIDDDESGRLGFVVKLGHCLLYEVVV